MRAHRLRVVHSSLCSSSTLTVMPQHSVVLPKLHDYLLRCLRRIGFKLNVFNEDGVCYKGHLAREKGHEQTEANV